MRYSRIQLSTHSCAHHVAQTKIKAALLVHGVLDSWQLRKGRPVMVKRIIAQTIIGTAAGKNYSHGWECETFRRLAISLHTAPSKIKGTISQK